MKCGNRHRAGPRPIAQVVGASTLSLRGYSSLNMREGEMVEELEGTPAAAFSFAELLSETRSPETCINNLQLPAHPSIREFVADGVVTNTLPHHLATRVIYHADL